nr:fatty acid-binding protein 5 isoform X1 [Peromyscus maniculatus bairdii]
MECAPSPPGSGRGEPPHLSLFSVSRPRGSQPLIASGPAGARARRPAVDPLQSAHSKFRCCYSCPQPGAAVLPHHLTPSWQHPLPMPTRPHLLFLDGATPLPPSPWGHRVVGRGFCRSPLEAVNEDAAQTSFSAASLSGKTKVSLESAICWPHPRLREGAQG